MLSPSPLPQHQAHQTHQSPQVANHRHERTHQIRTIATVQRPSTICDAVNTQSPSSVPRPGHSLITTQQPTSELLRAGLSPIFPTDRPCILQTYLSTLCKSPEKETPRTLPQLTEGVLAIAISYPHIGEPSLGCTVTSELLYRISTAVCWFARLNNSTHCQIWIDLVFFARRFRFPTLENWQLRLIPFLTLPVLYVPSALAEGRSICDDEFRVRVESVAAALGKGRFATAFHFRHRDGNQRTDTQGTSTILKCEFRFASANDRRDDLRSRFDALVFAVLSTCMLDRDGVCDSDKMMFRVAGEMAFPTVHAISRLTPVTLGVTADDVVWQKSVLGIQGAFEWIRGFQWSRLDKSNISAASDGNEFARLYDSIAPWLHAGFAMALRKLVVRQKDGRLVQWVVICRDEIAGASVALVVVLVNDVVDRSSVFALRETEEFLDLTSDIDIVAENQVFITAVEDLLLDERILIAGERVVNAEMVNLEDELLSRRWFVHGHERLIHDGYGHDGPEQEQCPQQGPRKRK